MKVRIYGCISVCVCMRACEGHSGQPSRLLRRKRVHFSTGGKPGHWASITHNRHTRTHPEAVLLMPAGRPDHLLLPLPQWGHRDGWKRKDRWEVLQTEAENNLIRETEGRTWKQTLILIDEEKEKERQAVWDKPPNNVYHGCVYQLEVC